MSSKSTLLLSSYWAMMFPNIRTHLSYEYMKWSQSPTVTRLPLTVCFHMPGTVLALYTSVSVSVHSLSRVWLFATPWIAARQASLSITNSRSPPKPLSIMSVMPSNHLILCHPLLLLPSIFPSISVFSNESALRIRWPKLLEFQLQHQSFQWTPRTDLFQDGLVGFCSPEDSQESSPTPQVKSINSSVLSFLYSPTLTSIHDYWKNHSLD